VYDRTGIPQSLTYRFTHRCQISYELILMKALAPSGVSTEDGFWANHELLHFFQKLSQPEICTGRGALAGEDHKEARGRDLRPSSG
jgi:hypothetical protein